MQKTDIISEMKKGWSKEEKEILSFWYLVATKEYLMLVLPNRTWSAICKKAYYLDLKRSYKAKGDAIRRGKFK